MADRSQRITGQNWHCRRQFFAIFVVTVKTKTLFSESKADAEGIMKHLDTGTGLDVPAGNYMFKANITNTRTRCEKCSKLTIKTPEQPAGVDV